MDRSYAVYGILLLGGSGSRFSDALPKQFHHLSGKKIYLRTFEAFLDSQLFDGIILVVSKEHQQTVESDLKTYEKKLKNVHVEIAEGGSTRQQSSYHGILKAPDTSIVVIHDAVRPFVTYEILKNNILAAKRYSACDTCIASTDTVVFSKNQKSIDAIPKRSNYLRGQTPQSFDKKLLLQAHEKALKDGIVDASDDCQLLLRLDSFTKKSSIEIVEGSEFNLKITSSLDLFLAEQIFGRQKEQTRQNSLGSLEGKVYVVTGGSGGIGKEICNLLQKEKATAICLSKSSLDYQVNLCNYEETKAVFEKIHKRFGTVDGLINSVGYLKVSKLRSLTSLDITKLISENFTSLIHSCKFCKVEKGGHIINISSSSYHRGRENFAIYSGAKAAVVNFTQGFAEEHPELNVNALIPSRTNTKMRRDNFPKEDLSLLLSPELVAKKVIETLKKKELTGMALEVTRLS